MVSAVAAGTRNGMVGMAMISGERNRDHAIDGGSRVGPYRPGWALACASVGLAVALGGALLAPLFPAFHALAALRLDEAVEMLLAVVVGDLVAGRDVLDRRDQDLALLDVGLGIGPAGMVDVARDVAPDRAVGGPALVDLEQVTVVELVGDRVGDARAPVLDDEIALVDRLGGEQAETGARAGDAIGSARGYRWHEAVWLAKTRPH